MSSPTVTTAEIFNKVAVHLLTQREQCILEHSCKYRGPRGTKCAVGCVIGDEFYSDSLEGLGISSSQGDGERRDAVRLAVEKSIGRELTRSEMGMLRELQRLHDNSDGVAGSLVEYWIEDLPRIAGSFGITISDEVMELMKKG